MEKQGHGHIPDDCWELTFEKMRQDDEGDLDLISLVSKRFLSISNQMKRSLKANDETLSLLPNLVLEKQIRLVAKALPPLKKFKLVGFDRFRGPVFGDLIEIAFAGMSIDIGRANPRLFSPHRHKYKRIGLASL
ncbi:hypothetical protein RHSIM_Rhsim01G0031100 [Rhododendron simsii]|uniref:F-box domain-containing protein n=1 Tax=Rhododendron simsii TaxID=118357 RepID=A0A834HJJ3_RHOSS|nr:hypothetical protein RHSIM_Rhsim01G0031100 [Rhododendron simsii]